MLLNLYSVFDSKVKAFNAPFTCRTHDEAMRIFQNTISNKDHPFAKNPEDFFLYFLGTFQDDSGVLAPENLISLAKGIDYVQPELSHFPV